MSDKDDGQPVWLSFFTGYLLGVATFPLLGAFFT
jgi:hypothetical protein